MKKFFTLFVMACLSLGIHAASIKLDKGNISIFKEAAAAIVEFDYSNCRWEKTEDFQTWCGADFLTRKDVIRNSFLESFNRNSKGLRIQNDNESAKYKMTFELSNLERHQSMTGMWGQGTISVTGTLHIFDLSTGTEVMTITINKFGEGKDFTHTDGMGKTFRGLAKALLKIKK